jgi:uncharacterized membrane protein YheB (UPF0754 family)
MLPTPKTKKWRLGLLSLFATALPFSHAEQTPQEELKNKVLEDSIQILEKNIHDQLELTLQSLPQEARQPIRNAVRDFTETLKKNPDLNSQIQQVLQKSFTPEEIKQLNALLHNSQTKQLMEKYRTLAMETLQFSKNAGAEGQAGLETKLFKTLESLLPKNQ